MHADSLHPRRKTSRENESAAGDGPDSQIGVTGRGGAGRGGEGEAFLWPFGGAGSLYISSLDVVHHAVCAGSAAGRF